MPKLLVQAAIRNGLLANYKAGLDLCHLPAKLGVSKSFRRVIQEPLATNAGHTRNSLNLAKKYDHTVQVPIELQMHCAAFQRFVKMPEALVWQHHLLINGGFAVLN